MASQFFRCDRQRQTFRQQQTLLHSHLMLLSAFLVCILLCSVPFTHASDKDKDPLERVNRSVFYFNSVLDRYMARPVAVVYDKVTPSFFRIGINNFFNNFLDVNAAVNAVFQGRGISGLNSTSRVLVNSTFGFFGFFDVASDVGIPRYQTDFGHTLAIWGVSEGPYLMLPFLGPRTLRSTLGMVADFYASPYNYIDDDTAAASFWVVNTINLRANLLGGDELLSGDHYMFIRDAYLQRRAILVSDGEIQDDFLNLDDDWESSGL